MRRQAHREMKTQEKILKYILDHPYSSINQIAINVFLSSTGVLYHIKKFLEKDIIRRSKKNESKYYIPYKSIGRNIKVAIIFQEQYS